MEYIWNTTDFKLSNTAVSLGKFDGFHIGHRLLIDYVTSLKRNGLTAVTFTFFVHPKNLIKEQSIELIYTEEEKCLRASRLGTDILVSYPFHTEIMNMEPEDFAKEVIVKKLDAKVVVVGKDFCFGKKRSGNVSMLKAFGEKYGFEVVAFEKVLMDGEEVSSTRIRKNILNGNIELVNKMLGENYSVSGEVIYGNQLGRTMGIPTANFLPAQDKLLPPNGVYATKVRVDDEEYRAVTNVGNKPTVGEKNCKGVETYIFDFTQNLYGKNISVDFYTFVRGEKKFDSIEALKDQIELDCNFVKEYFKGETNSSV
ncbi:bifunctional riboflavin kinase/FAD synthetase [Anaeromicropila populeti]|uniref:Riboflavin biosynthesis protein n=1 Tax=Anaeromicropila populeti TaxID=37658 RepID=A0A1I6JS02_9FIRM|nr:bifunctional riboflavin kinase/FAD synthetase [Anaeromicropila populeti]SFR81757.1 riboflavin kinase / FMN adenylyltransferase [Anaeromicropila populeti]